MFRHKDRETIIWAIEHLSYKYQVMDSTNNLTTMMKIQ